jgi:hypothetical protein
MPRLKQALSAETRRQGTALHLAFLQVTGLVQDVGSDIGRLRPGTEATAWMQTRRAAGRHREGTRA